MTVTSDFDPDIGIIIDARRRISSYSDSLALINPFTQATDANKPRLSIAGKEENVFLNSGDLENASWSNFSLDRDSIGTVSGFNAFSLTELAATATHYLQVASSIPAASGQTCKILWRVKGNGRNFVRISRGGGPTAVTFGLTGAGTKLEATATGNITLQSDGYYLCEANIPLIGALTAYFELKTALTTGAESYAGDGTSGILCYEPQLQFSAGAENTPLTTTDHPIYAGINGRQVLTFNGTQTMVSTSTLANIYAAGSKLAYAVVKPFLVGVTAQIFGSDPAVSGNRGNIRGTSGSNTFEFREIDSDGLKIGFSPVVVANQAMIIRGIHTGGFLTVGIDTGSGFVDGAPVACADGTNLTTALGIGKTTDGFYGQIAAMRTYNVGTLNADTTAYENSIRNKYLSGGGMSFNPLTGKLVYKGRSGISI